MTAKTAPLSGLGRLLACVRAKGKGAALLVRYVEPCAESAIAADHAGALVITFHTAEGPLVAFRIPWGKSTDGNATPERAGRPAKTCGRQ